MAIVYASSIRGSDTTGTGASGSPYLSWEKARSVSATGANSILLERGGTYPLVAEGVPISGNSDSQRFYIGAWGTGARPIIVPGWAPVSSTYLWGNLQGRQWITYEDLIFDGLYTTNISVAFNILIAGASDITGITARRCAFRNAGFTGGTGGTGAQVTHSGVTNAANSINQVLFEYCHFHDNRSHGTYGGGTNTRYFRCKAYRNGQGTGAHGFSTGGGCTASVTTGWSNVTGTRYSRSVATEVYAVLTTTITAYRSLRKNVTTPTTPATGEFGWSGGTLYIDVGVDPSGETITYSQNNYSVLWDQCEAYQNYAYSPYAFSEGAGFQFDDSTSNGIARSCFSHNNSGDGFSCNRNLNVQMQGCLAFANATRGFRAQNGCDVTWRNLTSVGNAIGGSRFGDGTAITVPTEELYILSTRNVTITNLAVDGKTKAAAITSDVTSQATSSLNNACITGVTNTFAGGSLSGSNQSIGTPVFDSYFVPTSGAPQIGAGTTGAQAIDAYGNLFLSPPSVGALEFLTAKTASTARTAATARSTATDRQLRRF